MHEQFHNKSETREQLPEPVYYIESSDDNTVLVGINPAIEKHDDGTATITWHDTTRERAMTADEIRQEEDYFAFKRIDDEGGQFYKFTPMDLDIYNDVVKRELHSTREFSSKEELIRAFLKVLG